MEFQSNEVGNANACELEGLKRNLQDIKPGLIKTIITDRHPQITKWIKENLNVHHYFDVWHVAKGNR